MRSRTATWFECKVRYDQTQENGSQKAVTEQYVVDALSFAEAEARITEQLSPYISGEFEVTDVKKAAYKEIFFMGDAEKTFHNEVEELARAVQKGDKEKADEVFHRPLEQQTNTGSRYYKAKLQFITIDEKTGSSTTCKPACRRPPSLMCMNMRQSYNRNWWKSCKPPSPTHPKPPKKSSTSM